MKFLRVRGLIKRKTEGDRRNTNTAGDLVSQAKPNEKPASMAKSNRRWMKDRARRLKVQT